MERLGIIPFEISSRPTLVLCLLPNQFWHSMRVLDTWCPFPPVGRKKDLDSASLEILVARNQVYLKIMIDLPTSGHEMLGAITFFSNEDWSSQLWTQFMQLHNEAWKKFRTSTGFEPMTSRYQYDALTNWAMKVGSYVPMKEMNVDDIYTH